jgi:NADH:ubiquinone oxidoreductase subunit K
MPQLDMVLLIWAGLAAMFVQSLVARNTLITVTVSVGFMIQAVLMALIFFS